jgi:hypothetical protein
MQNITTNIILILFLSCGLLLLYRAIQSQSNLTQIETKITARQIEVVSTHNQSHRYGLTFSVDNNQDKFGIYLGPYEQASQNQLINKVDTVSLYTILVDPTVSTSNGINLGVKELNLNGKNIYKESNKFNLVGGLIFTTVGLVGLLIIAKHKRTKNAS